MVKNGQVDAREGGLSAAMSCHLAGNNFSLYLLGSWVMIEMRLAKFGVARQKD